MKSAGQMPRGRRLDLSSMVIAVLFIFSGCRGCAAKDLKPASPLEQGGSDAEGIVSPEGEFIETINERVFLLGGEEDLENLYLSTVMVRTFAPTEAGIHGTCGGVLISPRLVLTAGHCVCARRKVTAPGNEAGFLVDGSTCADTASVATVTYLQPKRGTGMGGGSLTQRSPGRVRPHPRLKIVVDAQERVVSVEADLAVIVLDEPVAGDVPLVELASTEVKVGEIITMVGYGFDEVLGGREGQRRFIRYKVTRILGAGGRVQYEQRDRAVYKGDSGGPCLRGGRGHAELLGISSRGLGEEPTFTSTYVYRGWVLSELQRAAITDAGSGHDPP